LNPHAKGACGCGFLEDVSGQILLVDSDPAYRAEVAAILTRHGHRVRAAAQVQEALEEASRDAFEVVLVDARLPGVGGSFENLGPLTALSERLSDPDFVVVGSGLSAEQQLQVQASSRESGVVLGFVERSADAASLLLAVEGALERTVLRRERARLEEENRLFALQGDVRQRCLELLSTTDLEWLQERILWDLGGMARAQSAALWIADDRELLVLRAWRGLVDRQLLPEKLAHDAAGLEPLAGGLPWLAGHADAPVLYVPLQVAGEVMGLVQLSDPLGAPFALEEGEAGALRFLADFAAVAIRNARRFLTLQRQGLRDRDTAAYNLSYFSDYASKEIYKARRYARTFSLVTFSLDRLEEVRERLGPGEARRAHRGVIRAISRITRDSDVLAKASEHEFYLLLPETDSFGALMFLRRAWAAVRDEPDAAAVEARLTLGLTSGSATFPKDGEDFDELIHCSRRRMDERRGSLQALLSLGPLPFWDQVELLLGAPESPGLPSDPRADPSRRGKVSDALFEEVQGEIARELLRDPTARGVLYVGGPEVRASLPVLTGLSGAPEELGARVYALGRRADVDEHPIVTPVFLEGDERIARHEFLLWLTETSAYALIQRRGRGATWAFHSSDICVVDGLIARLQSEYDLQPF